MGAANGLSLLALLPSCTVRPDSSGQTQMQILINLNHVSNPLFPHCKNNVSEMLCKIIRNPL